ncbi:MAG TPA: biopolymer transporter ExbD [Myxococcota bacterium]|nr:biopolymer transporter ExbD [Myxococcota bacterium]
MAGASGGGKRDLNAELNLIPIINLMSVLVCFLLLTATWTEMTKLETSQSLDGGSGSGEKPPRINITVHDQGYEILLPDAEATCSLPKSGVRYDEKALKSVLERVKNLAPGKLVIGVNAVDELSFENVADVMDVCASLGLKNVSLGQLVGTLTIGPRCSGGG